MILHCPCCHAQFSIEALTQDEAARELLASRPAMLPSLLPYLSLFRTGKRALTFDMALAMAKQASTLCDDPGRLEAALAATVESIRAKRDEGQFKPLKNHNYLKKVIEDMPSSVGAGLVPAQDRAPITAQASKTVKAIGRLEDWKRG